MGETRSRCKTCQSVSLYINNGVPLAAEYLSLWTAISLFYSEHFVSSFIVLFLNERDICTNMILRDMSKGYICI